MDKVNKNKFKNPKFMNKYGIGYYLKIEKNEKKPVENFVAMKSPRP